jgi:hypothetical protein
MIDLGVLAIEPSSLRVLAIDKQEASKGQLFTLRREHGLNRRYLQFHLDNIYAKDYEVNEIRLPNADQEL